MKFIFAIKFDSGKLKDGEKYTKGTFYVTKNVTLKHQEVTQWGIQLIDVFEEINRRGKTFNGEAAMLFRACFHIEGDWRPFEDGILWENEEPPHPLKFYI